MLGVATLDTNGSGPHMQTKTILDVQSIPQLSQKHARCMTSAVASHSDVELLKCTLANRSHQASKMRLHLFMSSPLFGKVPLE